MKTKYIYATSIAAKAIRCKVFFDKGRNSVVLQVSEKKIFWWKIKIEKSLNYFDSSDNIYQSASKIRAEVEYLFDTYNDRVNNELHFGRVVNKL